MNEYDNLKLNPLASPYATYGDCPPSPECDYCEDGEDFPRGHSHEMYENREGASHRTADELADIFLDAVEFYALPWQRPDYCPRDVEGWLEDADDSQTLSDCIALGESALSAVGLYVSWNDGYVIERVRPFTVHVSEKLRQEYAAQRREHPTYGAKTAALVARWLLAEPEYPFSQWDDGWHLEREAEGYTIHIRAGYDEWGARSDWLGDVTDSRYRTQVREGKRVAVYPYVENERNPRAWYFDGSEMATNNEHYAYVQLEYTREMFYGDARNMGMAKDVAHQYAAQCVREDIARLLAEDQQLLYVAVNVYREGTEMASAALHGLDVDYDKPREMVRYLSDTAAECVEEAMAEAREKLTALVTSARGLK